MIVETDLKSKSAIIELRNMVQSRPITFTAANFFRIDYALLVSTATACITYTIILAKL
uniref:Gustatory receptor n=1 Tax=Histia rhodope TaxID=1453155 RepID=A0A7G4KBY6_9NEOP|nr:gustatory receptor [Histia rhodope]